MKDTATMCMGDQFVTADDDRGTLYRCCRCLRISRTGRAHQVPGPTTESHDKTMGILWDSVARRDHLMCFPVLDPDHGLGGTDTDGTVWHHCITHDEQTLALTDDLAYCNGYTEETYAEKLEREAAAK